MKRLILFVCTVLVASTVTAAEVETVTGVVTNVSAERQSITVRNSENGMRRTYFFDENTRITANGNPIALNRVRKGNSVTLNYRATDTGRFIQSARLPDPSQVVDIAPVEMNEVRTVSGRVTGVRPSARTLTIRDDATRQRRTLIIPAEASITRDGRPLALRDIERGNNITARYRMTDQGLILVTARAPEPAAEAVVAEAPAAVLPKTAGHVFAYLFLALGLLGAGAGLRWMRS